MAETRKLAAILAADVVGYSRLAGSDEERTLARLRALWSDLIDPTIAVHHGRVSSSSKVSHSSAKPIVISTSPITKPISSSGVQVRRLRYPLNLRQPLWAWKLVPVECFGSAGPGLV
jgi:class 3 adenylate cyclase